MNERIFNLVYKVGGTTYDANLLRMSKPTLTGPYQIDQFVKLIANECTTWINDNVGIITPEAKAELNKHLGLE